MMKRLITGALFVASVFSSHAHAQSWKQMQWGLNTATSPYQVGVNLAGSWYQVATLTSSGAFSFVFPSYSCASSQWVSASNSGGFLCSQPSFSNISGTISASQLIAPGASTFGAVKSSAAPSNQYATGINTSGVVTYAAIGTGAMPAFTGGDCTSSAGSVVLSCRTTLLARVNNNTALSALASTYATSIIRLGYAAAGDAPPVVYTSSNSACSLNSGAGDGGSQVPTSDGKCWLGSIPEPADVSIFGGKGDGATDDSDPVQNTIASGRTVLLPAGKTYLISKPLVLNSGQGIEGWGSALKRAAQASTTTTTSISPSVYTITVADASAFKIGQYIAALNGSTFSTNVPITGISGNNITVGSNFGITVSGTTTIYRSFDLLQISSGFVRGLEINGNASNHSFYRWQNTREIVVVGGRNLVEANYIHDAPGEAIMEGGSVPVASPPINKGNRYIKNSIITVNGNGIHLSMSIAPVIDGNHIESTNLQGSTMGHNGGNITFSYQIRDARVTNNYLASGRAGVGELRDTNALGATISGNVIRSASTQAIEAITSNNNSASLGISVVGNKFYDCAPVKFSFTQSLSTVTPTGNTTNGSPTITNVSNMTSLNQGAQISGSGIPTNSIVLAIDATSSTITIGDRSGNAVNASATATGVTLTVTGEYPYNALFSQNYLRATKLIVEYFSGVTVSDNTFEYTRGDTSNVAVALNTVSDAVFSNNQFKYASGGIYAVGLKNVTINANLFAYNYSYAAYFDTGTYSNVLFTSNNVSNDSTASASYNGVVLSGLANISTNTFTLAKGNAAVAVSVNAAFVQGNYISKGAATYTVLIYGGVSNAVAVNNKLNGTAVQDNGTGDTVTPNY